jgi:hypothetical protein
MSGATVGFWRHCRQDAGFEDDQGGCKLEHADSVLRDHRHAATLVPRTLLLIALLSGLLAKGSGQ